MIAATATVAIPTRNRRGRLIPLLERLIPQAADVGADILVVDNGSSDGRAFWTGWGEGFIDARYQRLRKVAGRLRWHYGRALLHRLPFPDASPAGRTRSGSIEASTKSTARGACRRRAGWRSTCATVSRTSAWSRGYRARGRCPRAATSRCASTSDDAEPAGLRAPGYIRRDLDAPTGCRGALASLRRRHAVLPAHLRGDAGLGMTLRDRCAERATGAARALLIALVACVVALTCVEIALRSAIHFGLTFFRRPGLYVAEADDDYWKLWHAWMPTRDAPPVGSLDPVLGWSTPRSADNPLGLSGAECMPPLHRVPILFYGDSFVAGTATPCPSTIPRQLERLLPDHPVYNFGVGGYGVDQAYLRLAHTLPEQPAAAVLFGIFTGDLDRVLLTVRTAPKPYFTIDGEALALHEPSTGGKLDTWYAEHPPQIISYALGFLLQRTRLLLAGGAWLDVGVHPAAAKRITGRLLDAATRATAERHVPLVLVVFYGPRELHPVGWREQFLADECRRLDRACVDTKATFLDAARARNEDATVFYLPDGHLNAEGNAVVAAELARVLRTRVLHLD